jgi:hypothetical protein
LTNFSEAALLNDSRPETPTKENYRDLRSTIYDQLMQGITKMLRRLNIGYTVPTSAPLQPTAAGEAAAGDDKSKATEQSAKKGAPKLSFSVLFLPNLFRFACMV